MQSRLPTYTDIESATDYYPFGMQMPGRKYSADIYRFGFNGKEKDDEVKGNGNSYNFGARIEDPRICRFLSLDPKYKSSPWQSNYLFADNSPIDKVDKNGEYGVQIHYDLTNKAALSLGFDDQLSDLIAHYSSTYADHPEPWIINATADKAKLSYRSDINYGRTATSQFESNSKQHSMRSNKEAKAGFTREQAMQRGMEFGWEQIFLSASSGKLVKNSPATEAFGIGIHALQDAYAHQGASTNEHLGKNLSSAKMILQDIMGNDQLDNAGRITESAIIVRTVLNGNNNVISKALENGISTLNLSGMTKSQFKSVSGAFNKAGYNLNKVSSKDTYNISKIDK